jgi:short-subunit dehydrogenase
MTRTGDGAVLITGCSTGIGRALAEEFLDRGYRVLATARNQADLETLTGDMVKTARLDVSEGPSIAAAVEMMIGWAGQIDIVVNNAGFGLIAPIAEVGLEDLRLQFETNVIGLVAVSQAVVPHMVTRGTGKIVNIGSVSGLTTTPFGGAYSASKAAVHMLSDALRMELAPFGVKVVTVQPGAVVSAFGERAKRGTGRYRTNSLYSGFADGIEARAVISQVRAMPARGFARRVVDAVTRPNPPAVVRAGPLSTLLPFLARLPVRWRDRILSRKFGLHRRDGAG